MTEAYIMGFRKTAEAHGVDPDRLIKAAQGWGMVTGPLKRYWQLLRGGDKSIKGMRSFLSMNSRLDRLAEEAFVNKNNLLYKKIRAIQRHLSRSAGTPLDSYYAGMPKNIEQRLADVGYRSPTRNIDALWKVEHPVDPSKTITTVSDEVRNELSKVNLARLGTLGGGALLGGGMLVGNALGSEEPERPRRFYNHYN